MKQTKFDISSAGLHLLAMALMLCDHLWATVILGNNWLTCIGRLSFPIFAFLLVEGYFHTRNLRRYVLRLLTFAVLSEVPFNLMLGSSLFYPIHQNVIWTLLIGLWMIHLNEQSKSRKPIIAALIRIGTVILGGLLGLVSFADYNTAGVLMILVFYFFRSKHWWCYLGQLAGMYYINFVMLQGLVFPITLLGHSVEIPQQGLAILALIPIWLYRGRKGYTARWFQQLCYWFYPAHMLLLWFVRYLT